MISGQALWMKDCWAAFAAQNRWVIFPLDAREARAEQGLTDCCWLQSDSLTP